MARRQKERASADGPSKPFGSDHTRPAIRSYEDVADSEDDFETAQDRILLDGQKHDVRHSANDVEASDEEVLALPRADSDEEFIDSSDQDDDEEDQGEGEAGGDYEEGWGDAKNAYYNADDVSDEEDLKAEEEEALRIQKKALSKLNAEDYLDFEDWKDTEADDGAAEEEEGDVELLSTVVSKDLPKSELIKILHARHPEFTPFALEFQNLYGQLDELEVLAERRFHPQGELISAKLSALRNYLGVLAFYFALISSANAQSINIKEHEIMDSLVRSREAWMKLCRVVIDKDASDLVHKKEAQSIIKAVPEVNGRARKRKRATKSAPSVTAPLVQESYAPDSDDELEQTFKSLKSLPNSKSRKRVAIADNADTVPDQIDAEDAASRRRTLQFYASQIGNKKAKRNVVQSGDADLPYRERKKEREARLQKEAERRRGGRASEGADLDDEDVVSHDPRVDASGAQNDKTGSVGRREHQNDKGGEEEEEEYYALVSAASAAQKATKKQHHDDANALVRANRSGYAVPSTLLSSTTTDGAALKRGIGREIASNKGLTTRKPKENRNARVKKRVKYDAAKKRLASQKAVYKGPPVAAYAGEATGINQRVVKSTRLDQGSDRRR